MLPPKLFKISFPLINLSANFFLVIILFIVVLQYFYNDSASRCRPCVLRAVLLLPFSGEASCLLLPDHLIFNRCNIIYAWFGFTISFLLGFLCTVLTLVCTSNPWQVYGWSFGHFMLTDVKRSLWSCFKFVWEPVYGMADRAGAISNSLSAVFPGTTSNSILKAKGYFHVKKGLKDNKLRFSTEENYIKFEKDCRDVAGSETKEEFEHMVHLLAAKWRSREGDAVKWFLKEWCSEQYGTWYSGFTRAGLPNTNNSVERFNSALKRYVTKRRRLSLNKLLPACEDELVYHSIESGKRAFYCQPHFDRPKWIEAQIWANCIRGMAIETKAPAKGCFFVPSTTYLESLNSLPTVQVLRDAFNNYRQSAEPLHGENFGAFVQRCRSFWKLVTNTSPVFPEDCFTCNCPPICSMQPVNMPLDLAFTTRSLLPLHNWRETRSRIWTEESRFLLVQKVRM